ncbi:MAG: LysM peptidoglycan-binding domain-containing protein [Solirubrobacterales bacterium]|nr:LysM peptidoglycan-binding domain-containing protein [Solirubrobacterales bacterium]
MAHRRTPARWLAPLALVTCAAAVWAIASSDGGGGGDDGAATSTQRSTSTKSTTTKTRTTKSKPKRSTYTVKAGDTPSGIADQLGVSLDALLAANPDVDAQTLSVGQKLKIPR